MSRQFTSLITANDSASIDGAGGWRVSNPETIFDSKQLFDSQPLFWDDAELSGGSTSTFFNTYRSGTRISVANTTAGERMRQSYRRFNYQPGKTQKIIMTFTEFSTATGITKIAGYYDDSNGIFLKSVEGTVSIVRRTNVSATPTDNAVAQASWNIDPMDGSGPSGATIDWSKGQIFVIDLKWLGYGRVRCGLEIDGLVWYFHEFLNTNVLATVYMTTPNLPLRYYIANDGTGAADSFEHTCTTVISEGGQQPQGVVMYSSTAGTHVDATTENTLYAIIGMRLKSTHIEATVKILSVSLQLQTASHKAEWLLLWNPTVAGTFTYADVTNSCIQIATGATANTVTGGTQLDGGFFESGGAASGGAGSTGGDVRNNLILGSAIDGTVDEVVLAVRPVGGSSAIDVEGGITRLELS